MKKLALAPLLLATTFAAAQTPAPKAPQPYPSPPEIVAAAPAADWSAIASSDLLVMDLPPLNSKPRRVVIQLLPPPFSQGWIRNIRKLAAAKWWDGTAIVRVQDNYVTQWGDPTEKKPLPQGLEAMSGFGGSTFDALTGQIGKEAKAAEKVMLASSLFGTPGAKFRAGRKGGDDRLLSSFNTASLIDSFAPLAAILGGWHFGYYMNDDDGRIWPIHCYAMVGVGRNLSPDTGTGAELYAVIGHAPRHLDNNVALIGRVIEGMEHISSLPRGTGALGFYEKAEERTSITSIRLGNEVVGLPGYQYLSTDSKSFARYAEARANRRDPFFVQPAGNADVCNIPVPVRRVPGKS